MEPSLELLINKRDYDYVSLTKKIFNIFGERLTRAFQLHLKRDRNINWIKIEIFERVQGYVFVVGNMEVRPGDLLTVDGRQVLVTEENLAQYANSHTLCYVLNADVLQHGSVETLYKHINFVESVSRLPTEQEALDALDKFRYNWADIIQNPDTQEILDRITRPTVFESFDVSGLTDQQFESLRLFKIFNKDNIKVQ